MTDSDDLCSNNEQNYGADQLTALLYQRVTLATEYKALCYQLHQQLPQDKNINVLQIILTPEAKSALIDTIDHLLDINQKLRHCYQYTGIHESAIKALQQDAHILQPFQQKTDVHHQPNENETKHASLWSTNEIREFTKKWNPVRFLMARLRRFFVITKSIVTGENHFDQYFLNPVFRYISWIFLLPRLCVNLFSLFWHVVPHKNLSEKERLLNWKQRAYIQLQDKLSEISNDLIWAPGNALTCFLLIGTLSTPGVILSLAMFGWDLMRNIPSACIELSRLHHLIQAYQGQSSPHVLSYLQQHLNYKRKYHLFQCMNSIGSIVLTLLISNLFVLSTLIPILSAFMLVIINIYTIYMNTTTFKNPEPDIPLLETLTPKLILYLHHTPNQSPLEQLNSSSNSCYIAQSPNSTLLEEGEKSRSLSVSFKKSASQESQDPHSQNHVA